MLGEIICRIHSNLTIPTYICSGFSAKPFYFEAFYFIAFLVLRRNSRQ